MSGKKMMLIQFAGTRMKRSVVRRPSQYVSYAKALTCLPPQEDRLVRSFLADVAAGVLHEHVVQAGLPHLQARDLDAVAIQPAQERRDGGAGVRHRQGHTGSVRLYRI